LNVVVRLAATAGATEWRPEASFFEQEAAERTEEDLISAASAFSC
jgi:hypothetical protein